ncbi:MAG: protoheme IX farnesyltransferase [Proteobacteria bacterium]|nr:protoheme IX farnesyltransferase [Pseudomonadota bacterium]
MLRDYLELCKPRVVALMALTAIVAMFLAAPPGELPWKILVLGTFGISCAACSGGVINQLIDRHIDALMARTKRRPLAAGRVHPWQAWLLAGILLVVSMLLLAKWVNLTVAILSFLALVGYAGIYTLLLKRATPQNIVIGGLAGAMPPLLGWTAVTGRVEAPGVLLVLIIYTWTPPHFWALAIHRYSDYAKANIPMLPVTHGMALTRLNILLYTLLMIAATYLPFIINASGLIYCLGVTILNGIFLAYTVGVYRNKNPRYPYATFRFSIIYLMLLFLLLLTDHFI